MHVYLIFVFTNTFFYIKMGHPQPLFNLFPFISNDFTEEKTDDKSGFQTRIVSEEGVYADHLTTTTALQFNLI